MKQMIYAIIVVFSFWFIISFIVDSCTGNDFEKEERRLSDVLLNEEKITYEGCRDFKISNIEIYEETDSTFKFTYTFEAKGMYGNRFGHNCEGVCDKNYKIIDCDCRAIILRQ